MIAIIAISCFVTMATASPIMSNVCPAVQLQEEIDFGLLEGHWDLRFGNTDDLNDCMTVTYHSIDKFRKTMQMDFKYFDDLNVRKTKAKQMQSSIQVQWGSANDVVEMSGEGSGEEIMEFASTTYNEDYIATDYANYLIVADCNELGVISLNIFWRMLSDGMGGLHGQRITNAMKKTINKRLSSLGTNLDNLTKRNKRCRRFNRVFTNQQF